MKKTVSKEQNAHGDEVLRADSKGVKIFLISTFSLILLLVGFTYYLLNSNSSKKNADQISLDAVTEENGKQIINIRAKGGFTPNFITAKADKQTEIRITTADTFDCTSALNIPKLKYSRLLPSSGTTPIEVPAQSAGTEIFGTCNIGLYHFTVNFI